jgi:hypothetical protein
MPAAFTNPLPGVPTVESPFFEQLLAQRRPDAETERLARDLRAKGYAKFEFPLPDFAKSAAQLIRELDGTYQGRVQDAWKQNALVREIAANERVLEILEALYGRRAIPFQTLNFDRGTEQTFHTDIVHFSSMPERFMCGVWVALEDIGEDQGPLRYIPGSHAWPTYTNEHVGAFVTEMEHMENYPLFERMWQALIGEKGVPQETLTGKCGTALIWAANLIHGGSPQKDPRRTRYSQVTHYYFENCAYYTPLNSDPAYGSVFFREIVDIRTGAPVANMYCGRAVPMRHVERSIDYGIYRHGGLAPHKFF